MSDYVAVGREAKRGETGDHNLRIIQDFFIFSVRMGIGTTSQSDRCLGLLRLSSSLLQSLNSFALILIFRRPNGGIARRE